MPIVSTFIETLKRLIADPALGTKNTLLDPTMVSLLAARVAALTPDQVTWWSTGDVLTTEGALVTDVAKNTVSLDVDGFAVAFSQFRDGLLPAPSKIRRRAPTDVITAAPADRVQYILADATNGVLLLDSNMEVVRTFPGLTATVPLVGATYTDATSAVTATVASTELIFIACPSQHCVQVLNYATGALVATIGVPGTSGVPSASPAKLNLPVAVAVDETGSRLFIACTSGNIGPDVTNAGFVTEFNITTPASPTFVSAFLFGGGVYRLNNMQCQKPSDLFLEPAKLSPAQAARLWVSNGLGDVAAFTRAVVTDPWVPTLVIPAQGKDYVLGPDTVTSATIANNAIDVLTGSDTETRLYVAASVVGKVEVFRASGAVGLALGRHDATYGHHGIESTLPFTVPLRLYSTPLDPPLTFGVFTTPTGVVADEQIPDGETVAVPVLLVGDAGAGRVQRLRLSVYDDTNNLVTFNTAKSDVPVSVMGWFLPADATFPPEFLTVEVRDPGDSSVSPVIPSTPWREIPQAGFSVPTQGPTLTRYQFRVRVSIPSTATVSAYSLPALGVLMRQAW